MRSNNQLQGCVLPSPAEEFVYPGEVRKLPTVDIRTNFVKSSQKYSDFSTVSKKTS